MNRLNQIKLFLFDMDGTLYLGDTLFDFTKELLAEIKRQGKRYLFMTNNSSKSPKAYVEKLKKLGIEACLDDFITSSQATCYYLNEHHKGARLYVCGTASFKEELAQNGFEITEDMIKMLGGFAFIRFSGMIGMLGINFTKEQLLEINTQLNKIRKP